MLQLAVEGAAGDRKGIWINLTVEFQWHMMAGIDNRADCNPSVWPSAFRHHRRKRHSQDKRGSPPDLISRNDCRAMAAQATTSESQTVEASVRAVS